MMVLNRGAVPNAKDTGRDTRLYNAAILGYET